MDANVSPADAGSLAPPKIAKRGADETAGGAEYAQMSGGCLCGRIRYRVIGAPLFAGHCHCRDCQRVTGAGHATGAAFRKVDVEISGTLSVFTTRAASGREIRRFFCPTCGSMISSESNAGPGIVTIYAGTLDDPSGIVPRFALFSRDRPAWDHMAEDIKRHETAP